MATCFDRWEKDPFFPAAEEVQESCDRYQIVLFLIGASMIKGILFVYLFDFGLILLLGWNPFIGDGFMKERTPQTLIMEPLRFLANSFGSFRRSSAPLNGR